MGGAGWGTFFSQTFRAPPGCPGKIPGYLAKKRLVSLVSRDIPNFSAPTPSRGRPPPHPKISGQKFRFGFLFWSKNRTGENRTGEPRPSTRGPCRRHLRGMFRGESLKGNQPSWVLSWGLSWADSWGHSWAHSWVEVRFRLFCASSSFRP